MPKAVDLDLKRAEFMTASMDVIAQEGLSAATLRKIADEAGCTTGSLTHYFANRRALLLETLRFVHYSAGARMATAIDLDMTAEEKLLAVLEESLPLDPARFKQWRVWLAFWGASMDDKALTQENTRRYKEWLTYVESLLKPLVSTNELASEARSLVTFIDGLGVGIVRQKIAGRALANAQDECHAALTRYLSRNLSSPRGTDSHSSPVL